MIVPCPMETKRQRVEPHPCNLSRDAVQSWLGSPQVGVMADSAYNESHYRQFKRILRTANLACWRGCGRTATSPDHDPPLTNHTHVRGTGCCVLRPACATCQSQQGAQLRNARSSSGYTWP